MQHCLIPCSVISSVVSFHAVSHFMQCCLIPCSVVLFHAVLSHSMHCCLISCIVVSFHALLSHSRQCCLIPCSVVSFPAALSHSLQCLIPAALSHSLQCLIHAVLSHSLLCCLIPCSASSMQSCLIHAVLSHSKQHCLIHAVLSHSLQRCQYQVRLGCGLPVHLEQGKQLLRYQWWWVVSWTCCTNWSHRFSVQLRCGLGLACPLWWPPHAVESCPQGLLRGDRWRHLVAQPGFQCGEVGEEQVAQGSHPTTSRWWGSPSRATVEFCVTVKPRSCHIPLQSLHSEESPAKCSPHRTSLMSFTRHRYGCQLLVCLRLNLDSQCRWPETAADVSTIHNACTSLVNSFLSRHRLWPLCWHRKGCEAGQYTSGISGHGHLQLPPDAICSGYAQCQCDVAEFDLSGDVAAFSGCGFLGACLVM